MELRIKILGILFALASLVLLGRLFYWQIIENEKLSAQAKAQHTSGQKIIAHRGDILSSDGTGLATSIDSYLMYAFLPDIKDNVRSIANSLSVFTANDPESKTDLLDEAMKLEGLLNKTDTTWVPLKRKIDSDVKKNIEALKISGIGFDKEEARYYPESSVSAHLLGFVGKDDEGQDKGYFGLEGYYDLTLSGKPGYLEREANALGVPLLLGFSKEIAAVGGVDLVTHIDKAVQLSVERELIKGIERYGAKSGMVIVMNPQNGGIIALASYPSFDPAKYNEYDTELFKNPAISDSFEPGSVFKPIIMASGLDSQEIKPDTVCDICDGPYKVDKYQIETWDNKYYPDSTMIDVIKHSDNVGMVFVGNKLGKDKMYDYLDKFGLGEATGIDLQGESSPPLRKKGTWNIVDLATTTFGQGIAVTPIQMIRAIATIARGGVSITPQVVDKIRADGWEEDIKPEEGKRVISEKAAKEITEIMTEAAKSGEAKWTALRGFRVAGKTGTAQIPIGGHYDAEKTIASFVGFAPPEDPKFVMLVTLREPQSSQWASETAAPLWFTIAKDLFFHYGIQPEN